MSNQEEKTFKSVTLEMWEDFGIAIIVLGLPVIVVLGLGAMLTVASIFAGCGA